MSSLTVGTWFLYTNYVTKVFNYALWRLRWKLENIYLASLMGRLVQKFKQKSFTTSVKSAVRETVIIVSGRVATTSPGASWSAVPRNKVAHRDYSQMGWTDSVWRPSRTAFFNSGRTSSRKTIVYSNSHAEYIKVKL